MQDRQVKVLIIDDEEDLRVNIRDFLEDSDYIVYDAEDGFKGLELFKTFQPDVVLSDIRMPGIDGLSLLESIVDISPETPVIMVSGIGDIKQATSTIKLGAWDYLVKPIEDMHDLEKAIQNALQKAAKLHEKHHSLKRVNEQINLHDRFLALENRMIQFDSFVSSSEDAILTVFNDKVATVNPQAVEKLQCNGDTLVNQSVSDVGFKLSDGNTITLATLLKLAAKSNQFIDLDFIDCSGKRVSAEIQIVDILTPVIDQQQLVIIRNVTDRKQLERQLQQAQRLEAIARLAGGVAHDFNNLLTAISGNAELTKINLPNNHPALTSVEEILKTTERAGNLTRQLLTYSRNKPVEPKILNINNIALDLNKMLTRIIGEDVRFTTQLYAQPLYTKADPTHLEQIILNLCVNARDAMPEGGQITLQTYPCAGCDERKLSHLSLVKGAYICISVVDEGVGIDQETMKKIFDPFFTTKPQDKGTGLGLANVYSIVTQAGGGIDVVSEPGKGSAFTIYLPDFSDAREISVHKEAKIPDVTGSETILMVEDDEDILNITNRLLENNGYKVLAYSTPQEAIKDVTEKKMKFDLLITDVVMEGLNGMRLSEELRKHFPNMRVIYISGYSGDSLQGLDIDIAGSSFMQKPFRLQALLDEVRKILDMKLIP